MAKKILIVDDEPSIIVALQFLMEQNGYETLVAFSGEEAMDPSTGTTRSHSAGHHAAGVTGSKSASGCVKTRIGRHPHRAADALGSEAHVTRAWTSGDAYVTNLLERGSRG